MIELKKNDINEIYNKITVLIKNTQNKINSSINSELIKLYWNIGGIIKNDILNVIKPEYGENIINELSIKLSFNFGKGFNRANIYRMIQIYECFNDYDAFIIIAKKISWSHFVELLQISNNIKRKFYTVMTINEGWSVRVLRERINALLFERSKISKKPDELIVSDLELLSNNNKMSLELFLKDPYLFNFNELRDNYSEKDLEDIIIKNLQKFILEMGNDFAFISRQKRITIDGQDFYIDLLFYHRKLNRLVVVELKLEKFKSEYKGQVELYLKWLDRYEKTPDEEAPIAIILCIDKNQSIIELLQLDESDIHVAKYYTNYNNKKILDMSILGEIADVIKNK